MSAEIVEWKGKPILEITEEGSKYPFRFGLSKAEMIVKYYDQIREFIRLKKEKKNGISEASG